MSSHAAIKLSTVRNMCIKLIALNTLRSSNPSGLKESRGVSVRECGEISKDCQAAHRSNYQAEIRIRTQSMILHMVYRPKTIEHTQEQDAIMCVSLNSGKPSNVFDVARLWQMRILLSLIVDTPEAA